MGRSSGKGKMRATSELISVLVTLEKEHFDEIDGIADRLRSAGMNVENIMELVGAITGSIEAGKKETISHLKGVAHVETVRQFQLSPPDSKVR
jgi:hypothetical protein